MSSSKSCLKALVCIADGTEEVEFTAIVDVLRRAEIDVCVAGLEGKECVKCMWNVKICPDVALSEAKNDEYDIIVLPGGTYGVKRFLTSSELKALLQKQEKNDKWVAAVCAAPLLLKASGIAKGKKVTSYPTNKAEMVEGGEYKYCEDKVVVDGKVITSRGPGTSLEFALTIVEQVIGKSIRDKIDADLIPSC